MTFKHGAKRAFPSNAIDPEFGGMELRDWFAGTIASGLATLFNDKRRDCWNCAMVADWAYDLADAMMAEKEKRSARS